MSIGIWQLMVILAIVVLLFGTRKLRNLGGDLGAAVRSFRGALKDESATGEQPAATDSQVKSEGEKV